MDLNDMAASFDRWNNAGQSRTSGFLPAASDNATLGPVRRSWSAYSMTNYFYCAPSAERDAVLISRDSGASWHAIRFHLRTGNPFHDGLR
ncbi:MAG: hypothetical protein ACN6O6_02545 [Pseudomonas sp.]|uniref:hypothetical protein n=1 Tax=Pseudomonas sp. TaxID=306 RepID=UPI003D0F38E8